MSEGLYDPVVPNNEIQVLYINLDIGNELKTISVVRIINQIFDTTVAEMSSEQIL